MPCYRYHSSIATSFIKCYLRIRKTGLSLCIFCGLTEGAIFKDFLAQICADTGVKPLCLLCYLLDLNLIKDFYLSYKALLNVIGVTIINIPIKGLIYSSYTGGKKESAKGYFRHSGLKIEICRT
ncbi:hypothetical protein N7488_008908 [Penicillium malachiteum]|nr:hypothetical protein N7488_008908 [Penicillium malachiteum]